jgi:uncharacterized protein (TIGR02284 family)
VPQPPQNSHRFEYAVQSVIEILVDSQEGLVTVGEKVQDHDLKLYFLTESLIRAQFIELLEAALLQGGVVRFHAGRSAVASLHRTWARLKSRFAGGDHTLLATAAQGEQAVTEAYARAMTSNPHPPISELLRSQADHIQRVLAYVKSMRDVRSAAIDEKAGRRNRR